MAPLSRALLAVLLALAAAPSPVLAQDTAPGALDQRAIEEVVRRYLLENPEIIAEAIERLRAKQAAAQEAEAKQAVVARAEAIFGNPLSPVAGDLKGDVTIVEFFDHRCPVCKRAHPVLQALLKSDTRIRRIYKVWPILGPDSVFAGRAALAADRQGRFVPFTNALMEADGNVDSVRVLAIAKEVGLDVKSLERDMRRPEIDREFKANFELADALGIRGTPSFVIGGQVVYGTRDLAELQALVIQARESAKAQR
jgi:protein-disulfide isomerase